MNQIFRQGYFMIKPLGEFAQYLKGSIPDIPADYAISLAYENIVGAEKIRNGVLAFRDFLCRFYDYVTANADLHDNPKPNADRVWGGVNFSMDYPFLRDMAMVLFTVGIYGKLNESGNALVLSGSELSGALKKARVPKPEAYMRYLTECGAVFNGIDLESKKPDLSLVSSMEVSYPVNSVMPVGLRLMAIAQLKTNEKRFKPGTSACVTTIDNIFLRCDYRAFEEEEAELVPFIKDIVKPFSAETQGFVLKLHQRFTDVGFKCEMTTGRNSSIGFYLLYAYKSRPKKVVQAEWIIGITPKGCGIKIDAGNTGKYMNIFDDFPASLSELIKNGSGCIYKSTPKKCKLEENGYKFMIGGAEYIKCSSKSCSDNDFWAPLSDITDEERHAVEGWIESELLYL